MEDKKDVFKNITLHRSYFVTNSLGESEFDWFLNQLGFKTTDAIDEVEIDVSEAKAFI